MKKTPPTILRLSAAFLIRLHIKKAFRVMTLRGLIFGLQRTIENGGLNKDVVLKAIESLSRLGYQYDDKQFPALVDTDKFEDSSCNTPSNLAEALLWKLGKWESYKRFSGNYANPNSMPTRTDVVFFAFAKHLVNKDNPIYDQHAIRALWAICGKLTDEEKNKCKSLLIDSNGKWKTAGSGKYTIECYELFVKHVNCLVSGKDPATKGDIDRLLMPLGQAIKKLTKNYDDFCALCQPDNG